MGGARITGPMLGSVYHHFVVVAAKTYSFLRVFFADNQRFEGLHRDLG